MEITGHTDKGWLKIYINGLLHIALPIKKINGVQAWADHGWFVIECHSESSVVVMEYNTIEKWRKILEIINTHL